MNIIEKYKKIRPLIKNGDIILFKGNKFISKAITFCDKPSVYSHAEIIFIANERIYIQGSHLNGNHPDLLSHRIKEGYSDFEIIQPNNYQEEIVQALKFAFKDIEENLKYDLRNGLKEMVNRLFDLRKKNISFKITQNHSFICSEFVKPYAQFLKIMSEDFNKIELPFPQDYIRFIDLNKCKLLSNLI